MTLTVTATPNYSEPSPTMLVRVTTATVWRPVNVWRIHPDGTEYQVIRAVGNKNLIAGVWFGVDRHAPFNTDVKYRAATATESGTSGAAQLPSTRSWLVHPSDPDLSVQLSAVRMMASREWADRTERLDILNSSTPIHLTAPTSVERGALTAQVTSPAEFQAIRKLVGGPVLLKLVLSDYDVSWLWAVIRSPKLDNRAPSAGFGLRDYILTFEGTRQPDVDAQSFWTVSDLADTGWTISQAAFFYPSVSDMAADNRATGTWVDPNQAAPEVLAPLPGPWRL